MPVEEYSGLKEVCLLPDVYSMIVDTSVYQF